MYDISEKTKYGSKKYLETILFSISKIGQLDKKIKRKNCDFGWKLILGIELK